MSKPSIPRKCQNKECGKPFLATQHDIDRGYGKYCSRSCGNRGAHNPRWKGGVSTDHYHYKQIQKKRYPEKLRARNLVRHAVKSGQLERLPCQVCGDVNSHAHHPNYAEPLKVIWLCRQHHKEIHQEVHT